VQSWNMGPRAEGDTQPQVMTSRHRNGLCRPRMGTRGFLSRQAPPKGGNITKECISKRTVALLGNTAA